MTYNNPPARDIFDSGLQIFGQLFNTDETGMILINSRKTFQTLEEEYEIQIPVLLRNRIAVIIRKIKQKYKTAMATTGQLFENVSTLQSLVRSKPTGCNSATRLILKSQRDSWEWGNTPRSFATYTREGLTNINSQQFSKAMQRTRANNLPPSTQWTNITIFLRTIWTNVAGFQIFFAQFSTFFQVNFFAQFWGPRDAQRLGMVTTCLFKARDGYHVSA